MIIVVRHGRTAANAAGLLLGRSDPELDDVGSLQAQRVAAALAGDSTTRVGRVLCSPLRRTIATAAAIGDAVGAGIDVEERVIELDYGDWDGTAVSDVSAADWATWRADLDFAPPRGESLSQLGVRVRSAFDDLAEEAREHDIVVVTHVSPVKAAVAWALGVGDALAWRMFVSPASISRISTAGPSPSLHVFNDTSHLTPG